MIIKDEEINKISALYGDAFYLLDTIQFKKNYLELQNAFREIYKNTHIAYSYKTNYTPRLCSIVDELGGFAEIVSDMEYNIAKKINVSSKKIYFNGPYKNPKAIEDLLLKGGTINIDSEYDFEIIKEIAVNNPYRQLSIGVRCNFDIGDGVLSRFGFDTESEDFQKLIKEIREINNLKLKGFHCHFASRKIDFWPQRASKILKLVSKYFPDQPDFISLGGGIFGKMDDSLKKQFDSEIPTYSNYANSVAGQFAEYFKDSSNPPMLIIEPGSALVGDCMNFISKVINIKKIRGKNIATVLGSIYNINPTLNKKNPPIRIKSGSNSQKEYDDLDFGGFTCIESDYLYRGYKGKLAINDFVIFGNIGSYSIVLKPPFILPNFPMVELNNNQIQLVKRHEKFEDLFSTYEFPIT